MAQRNVVRSSSRSQNGHNLDAASERAEPFKIIDESDAQNPIDIGFVAR